MRYFVVEHGTIVNVVVADAGFTMPGVEMVPETSMPSTAAIGWCSTAGTFTAPAAPTETIDTVESLTAQLRSLEARLTALDKTMPGEA